LPLPQEVNSRGAAALVAGLVGGFADFDFAGAFASPAFTHGGPPEMDFVRLEG